MKRIAGTMLILLLAGCAHTTPLEKDLAYQSRIDQTVVAHLHERGRTTTQEEWEGDIAARQQLKSFSEANRSKLYQQYIHYVLDDMTSGKKKELAGSIMILLGYSDAEIKTAIRPFIQADVPLLRKAAEELTQLIDSGEFDKQRQYLLEVMEHSNRSFEKRKKSNN
jgi:formate dehydrogenase maturation protein FdhE